MTNTWKGGLTLRIFFRVINSILLVAALLAAAFCGYFVYSVMNFPADQYNAQIIEANAQTEKYRADAITAREESEQRLASLRADIRNNGAEAVALADSIDEMKAAQAEKEKKLEEAQTEAMLLTDMPGGVAAARESYALAIRELEDKILSGESDVRICYWTLDDGPSYITENFLNALDAMDHVHVTFFTANGANDAPNEEELLRREMTSGHSVQNHTYSHAYWEGGVVYSSLDNFKDQIRKQDDWLFEVTGFRPGIFRFPGGSAWGRDLLGGAVEAIEELGYQWVDWNCNLYDAGAAENLPTAALETSRAVTQTSEEQIAIILSHDWNPQTLVALKSAVPILQEKGYVFLPLFPESAMMGLVATR